MTPTYPGSPEMTVDALLQRPQVLLRNLDDLTYQKFVADRILTQGGAGQVRSGAVWYQKAESIFVDRDHEEVGVRSEFPRAGWTEEIFSAFVHKYGLEVPISFEAIRRNQLDVVARAQRKLANGLVQFVDKLAMDLILNDGDVLGDSSTAPWDGMGADIIRDLATARNAIRTQNQGYEADTLVINPAGELAMLLDETIRDALPRETRDSAIQRGTPVPILGFDNVIVTSQLDPDKAIVCQAKVVGTIADEAPGASEKYESYDPGDGHATLYVKIYDNDENDERIVRCARFPAMWIAEPKAAYVISDVASPAAT